MSLLKDYPARVAALLASAAALAGALVVPLANLDLTSTAGVVAAVVAISGVVSVWLNGQKGHEANVSAERQAARWRAQEAGYVVSDELGAPPKS